MTEVSEARRAALPVQAETDTALGTLRAPLKQYVHCLKFTSRHFMYCLIVSKEQKEVFQISFYLYYTLTEVKI